MSHADSWEEAIPDRSESQPARVLLRSRGFWRVGGTARGPAWPEWAHSNERQRLGRQSGRGGGEDGWLVEGHCRATGLEGHKERLRQWSDVTPVLSSQTTRLLVLRRRGRDREAIAVWLVTLEVAGPRLWPVLLSPLCTFVLPDPGGSHQFSQELV